MTTDGTRKAMPSSAEDLGESPEAAAGRGIRSGVAGPAATPDRDAYGAPGVQAARARAATSEGTLGGDLPVEGIGARRVKGLDAAGGDEEAVFTDEDG